jgi:hypothetical protein
MAKKKNTSVWGDTALREFYAACGLSPDTIEGAIKARYEEPTRIVNWHKAIANVKTKRGHWSKSGGPRRKPKQQVRETFS